MKSEKEIRDILKGCIEMVHDYDGDDEAYDDINKGWIEALQCVLEDYSYQD